MKFIEIKESTVSGAVASVAKPLGKLKERTQVDGMVPAEKVMKGKSKKKGPYANSISEGKMKDLAYAIKHLNDVDFSKAYGQTKDYFTKRLGNPPPESKVSTAKPSPAPTKSGSEVWRDTGYTDKKAAKKSDEPIHEDELVEDDVIVLPGMLKGKDRSFIPKELDRRDHEVEMARSDLYAAAKDAMRIFKMLEGRSEDEGLMGWQQSYITLAADYLNSVADSIEYDAMTNEGIASNIGSWLAKKSLSDLPQTPDVKRAIANRAGQYSHAISDAGKVGAGAGAVYVGQAVGNKMNQAREKDLPKGKVDIEVLNPSNSDSLNYVVPNSKYKTQPNIDSNTIPPQSKQPLKPAGHLNKPFKQTAEGAGVIAGGMSNFEEDTVNEISDFKRKEIEFELRNEPKNNYQVSIDGRAWKVFADKAHAEAVARKLRAKGKKVEVYVTGASPNTNEEQAPMFTPESKLDEKKDACYSKVKSRYKVWPSAYASGALSKCRKVGASNWGNKSKK